MIHLSKCKLCQKVFSKNFVLIDWSCTAAAAYFLPNKAELHCKKRHFKGCKVTVNPPSLANCVHFFHSDLWPSVFLICNACCIHDILTCLVDYVFTQWVKEVPKVGGFYETDEKCYLDRTSKQVVHLFWLYFKTLSFWYDQ